MLMRRNSESLPVKYVLLLQLRVIAFLTLLGTTRVGHLGKLLGRNYPKHSVLNVSRCVRSWMQHRRKPQNETLPTRLVGGIIVNV